MTAYLSAAELLFIHSRLIAETGGQYGWLELGLLQSAVARPQATFDGQDLYPDLFDKAAALMQSLIVNHPVLDGNKRVAITAAALFLLRNGRQLHTTNEALEQFTMAVTTGARTLDEIAAWLQTNSQPAPGQELA